VFVTRLPGLVDSVTVTLNNFTHAFPHDAAMMLAGPTGTNLVFWSDSGGSTAVSGLNVTLSDMAASSIPSPVASGTFLPTAVNGPPAIAFPAPAPQPVAFAQPSGSSTLASQFKGINANGTWAFYIFDNQAGSGGSIGSVCLNFSQVAPVLSISKSHSGNFAEATRFMSLTAGLAPQRALLR
jgi:hypothetical protein